jgi:hypothetical protein
MYEGWEEQGRCESDGGGDEFDDKLTLRIKYDSLCVVIARKGYLSKCEINS